MSVPAMPILFFPDGPESSSPMEIKALDGESGQTIQVTAVASTNIGTHGPNSEEEVSSAVQSSQEQPANMIQAPIQPYAAVGEGNYQSDPEQPESSSVVMSNTFEEQMRRLTGQLSSASIDISVPGFVNQENAGILLIRHCRHKWGRQPTMGDASKNRGWSSATAICRANHPSWCSVARRYASNWFDTAPWKTRQHGRISNADS